MNPIGHITRVTAFVDWNSQVHAARYGRAGTPVELGRHTLNYIGRTIGRVLTGIDDGRRYDVTLRLYHGWYRGFEPTTRRRALIQVFAAADFASLSNQASVVIRPSLNFGDNLFSASVNRYFANLGCHLPNTWRKGIVDKLTSEEKMVDTAIASDFVDFAHREPDRWLMILGEDDDLVPPLFVAEGIRGGMGGKVILVRSRSGGSFLKLDELRYSP